MSKFEMTFIEPVRFTDNCWHVSREKYCRNQAALEISREIGDLVDVHLLKEAWVRFQFADSEIRDALGCSHCWIVASEGAKNAKKTWEYCGS